MYFQHFHNEPSCGLTDMPYICSSPISALQFYLLVSDDQVISVDRFLCANLFAIVSYFIDFYETAVLVFYVEEYIVHG